MLIVILENDEVHLSNYLVHLDFSFFFMSVNFGAIWGGRRRSTKGRTMSGVSGARTLNSVEINWFSINSVQKAILTTFHHRSSVVLPLCCFSFKMNKLLTTFQSISYHRNKGMFLVIVLYERVISIIEWDHFLLIFSCSKINSSKNHNFLHTCPTDKIFTPSKS